MLTKNILGILSCLLLVVGCTHITVTNISEEHYKGPIDADMKSKNIGLVVDPTSELIYPLFIPFKASDIDVTIVSVDGKTNYMKQSIFNKGMDSIKLPAGKHQLKVTCNGERWYLLGSRSMYGGSVLNLEVKAGATYYIRGQVDSFSHCSAYVSEYAHD